MLAFATPCYSFEFSSGISAEGVVDFLLDYCQVIFQSSIVLADFFGTMIRFWAIMENVGAGEGNTWVQS